MLGPVFQSRGAARRGKRSALKNSPPTRHCTYGMEAVRPAQVARRKSLSRTDSASPRGTHSPGTLSSTRHFEAIRYRCPRRSASATSTALAGSGPTCRDCQGVVGRANGGQEHVSPLWRSDDAIEESTHKTKRRFIADHRLFRGHEFAVKQRVPHRIQDLDEACK